MAEVVAAGVGLLQRAERERAAFVQSPDEAESEADRERWHYVGDELAPGFSA